MSKYKIRKGVPIPSRLGKASNYPFDNMDVGDSFVVPVEDNEFNKMRGRINSATAQYGRRHGMKFSVRVIDQKGSRAFGVWRVA